MKRYMISGLLALTLGLMALPAANPQGERFECFFCSFNRFATSGSPSNPQFERIKSLAGRWVGPGEKGKPIAVSYSVTANGSAVAETLNSSEGGTMITMYHRDADRLVATHYCSAGNQPRMAAVPSADKDQITFTFVDGTNLSQASGHMQGLTLRFRDKDHLAQKWTFLNNDGKEQSMEFTMHRVK